MGFWLCYIFFPSKIWALLRITFVICLLTFCQKLSLSIAFRKFLKYLWHHNVIITMTSLFIFWSTKNSYLGHFSNTKYQSAFIYLLVIHIAQIFQEFAKFSFSSSKISQQHFTMSKNSRLSKKTYFHNTSQAENKQ